MQDGWQILTDWSRLSRKATRMLQAMAAAAPAGTVTDETYLGARRGLMLYGPGAPAKLPVIKRHLKFGGFVAMWDMGYWDRKDAMRLSVNHLHPTPQQLELAPAGPGRRAFELRSDADPEGPILLIGTGPKSVFAYGLGQPLAWEAEKVRDLHRRFPGRGILWRPKGDRPVFLHGTELHHGLPIEQAMRGCSLVVSHHSNASVDAVIAGVPFETEQGAATWFAGRHFTPENRAEFLRKLSFWEWSRHEAPAAWQWIERITNGTN